MAHLRAMFRLSERCACGLLGIAVSVSLSVRSELRKSAIDSLNWRGIKTRFGYRWLHVLLARDGEVVNHMV